MEPREVPVTLHSPPGDSPGIPGAGVGFIADTPENRAALEAAAIPKCRTWREANPEFPAWMKDARYMTPDRLEPAPYCCSAYCDRCAGLRALDGEEPLTPNEWMTK